MNTKKIFLLLIIIILFIIAVFFVQQTKKRTPAYTQAPLSSGNKAEDKIKIQTSAGEILVNDFKKSAEVASSGVLYFVDKEEYNISYNSTDKEFIVTLLVSENIEASRKNAESDLLSALEISQDDACKLKVYLYVSAAIARGLSANHGLSFCPDSKPFPN